MKKICIRRLALSVLLMFGHTALAAPDGASLYREHCAACHGLEGDGGVGVPLALPAFLGSVSDAYLAKTIRHGRPGRVMPAFRSLSEAQVDALVKHLRGWSPDEAPSFSADAIEGDVQHGRKLYAKHCAECHGAEGGGGDGTGVTFSRPRDLPIIAPALNNRGFLASASDAMIKRTLMEGREGTPMASFLEQGLSEQDIYDLVAYVRSFEQQPAPIKEPPPADKAVMRIESSYSLDDTVANVKQAAIGRNFRIIRVQHFDQGLAPEGEENEKRVIVYLCNFRMLSEALAIDPRIGLFLPCRVTVVERDGQVEVMSVNPKLLSQVFNNRELDEVCNRMTDLYRGILEEATL